LGSVELHVSIIGGAESCGKRWADSVRGTLSEVVGEGRIPAVDALFLATVPLGRGLGGSGAIEAAAALMCLSMFDDEPDLLPKWLRDSEERLSELAVVCQRAEYRYTLAPCGIMDPYVSLLGKRVNAIYIDCDCRQSQHYAWPKDVSLALIDSGTEHPDLSGEYTKCRKCCERAAAILAAKLNHPVRFLRDVTEKELQKHRRAIPETDAQRALHVIQENQRVLRGRRAVEDEDIETLGALMYESHESSRTLFKNSAEVLDEIIASCKEFDGCYGAKLQGAGFGGDVVALIERDRIGAFKAHMARALPALSSNEERIVFTDVAGEAWHGKWPLE